MPVTPLDRFSRILADHVGYASQSENRARLERILRERSRAATNGDTSNYLTLLENDSAASNAEWQEIVRELTMSESFFFRDAAQFRLLRETLLPKLIARRSDRRSLRVWSAGCSTGEEPYSLAILVHELLPRDHDWDVCIVGTDINESALEHARRATYTPWSLRGLTPEQRGRYFVEEGNRFRLRPEYCRSVSFQQANLVKDRIPSFARGLHDMDLVVCRNVFIYFDAATTGRVAEKLAHALAPGGFLLTGHAELQGQSLAVLRTRVMPGSIVHERPAFELPPVRATPAKAPKTQSAPSPRAQPAPSRAACRHLEQAEAAFRRAEYDDALRVVETHLHAEPTDPAALRLGATAAANLGQHVRAARYCRRLLDVRPHDIEARYLLAKLAQDSGSESEARELLLALLADSPSFVPAYLDLAWLEKRRGDLDSSDALREEALRLLESLPSGTILSAYEGVTVEDLLIQLKPLGAHDLDREDR